MAFLVANSCTNQPRASNARRIVSSGEYSSHSLGLRTSDSGLATVGSLSIYPLAVCASLALGADHQAINTDTVIRIAVRPSDCHKKIVSAKGMTPVIAST